MQMHRIALDRNQDHYWGACLKEISTLQDDMDSWDIGARESWKNVLPST